MDSFTARGDGTWSETLHQRLLKLHEVALSLTRAATPDELCRLAVWLGHTELGFDRLGLWLRDPDDPAVGVGSYGIDEHGRLRDERGERVSAREGSLLGRIWGERERAILVTDCPLRDETAQVVGHGMAAFACVWDGEHVVGSLNCDNLVSGLPLTPDDLDVLTLHAATIGHLYSRQQLAEQMARSNAQLGEARQLQALGRLAGGVAHEYNNLLAVIMGLAELVQEALPPQHAARGDLRDIRRAAEQAAELTRQLLAFGQRQVLQPVLLDLSELVRRQLGLQLDPAGVTDDLAVGLPPVRADATLLDQAVAQVLACALRDLPPGGQLHVATRAVATLPSTDLDGPPADGPWVILTVADDGPGLDEEARRHVFEPFYPGPETDPDGGLGLASARGFVAQSGGRLWLDSAPGCGATYGLALPAELDHKTVAATAEPALVLVVEDSDDVRRLVRRMLRDWGFAVLDAASAEDGLQLVAAQSQRLRLLVADVMLPGLSGPDLAARLRQDQPGLPVVFITACAPEDVLFDPPPGGRQAVLVKPFRGVALRGAIERVLGEASPRDQSSSAT